MKILDELYLRGLVQDATDRDAIGALLDREQVTFYCGFDPSGASLHAGTLVPFSICTRLARAGHRPLAIIGGATGMVGDPSGKSEERKLQDPETLARNVASVSAQIRRFLPEAPVLNNADWTQLSYLEFLRTIGKHITVNYMLAKESVRARLEDREQGISYTEFSYMLLQAWDFAYLAKEHGCRLQVGGSDQWGNITCGIELSRKMGNPTPLYGAVTPLLMTAAGKKFGKSEAGTSIWLDPGLTSPYRFYQYWINAEDADVEKYLKMFTFLPLDEIGALLAEHDADRGRRLAQKRLAYEVTTWVHGADAARRAEAASGVIFGGSLAELRDADLAALMDDVPATALPRTELDAGLPLVDLLVRVRLAESKAAARRLLQQGGVYINNIKVDDPARAVTPADLATESILLLRAGKKSYHLLKVS